MADSVGMLFMFLYNPFRPRQHHGTFPPIDSTPWTALRTTTNVALCISPLDRVFVHALSTVKKIPRSGSARPPTSDRLRLYGLYKQAMEGDVDGVMERPSGGAGSGLKGEELQREREKWDAWNSQKGLGRTEAKRRYIEVLMDIMHKYATTEYVLVPQTPERPALWSYTDKISPANRDGQELVAELEFVWNQIKNNAPSSSDSSPKASKNESRRFQQPLAGSDGPMKVLSPMSEQDEAEMRSIAQMNQEDDEEQDDEDDDDGHTVDTRRGSMWSKTVERALVSLSAEVAALREQIATGREWRSKKEKAFSAWVGRIFWAVTKHILIDMAILAFVLLWMRRRKDRRLEDLARGVFRLVREYARRFLPSRE
ncbi:putative Endozepine-like protein [Zalerion maritima]|uniref:Endozepine-like protein n=1 Tax=Zalerion maritima TaxID=339359 RepID=A0AAD5RSA5_9PEZI|nr:putative Endozepine-like protein [Zalerion maritima]